MEFYVKGEKFDHSAIFTCYQHSNMFVSTDDASKLSLCVINLS